MLIMLSYYMNCTKLKDLLKIGRILSHKWHKDMLFVFPLLLKLYFSTNLDEHIYITTKLLYYTIYLYRIK